MGFKFKIEYKKGSTNKVADALSRRDIVDTDASLFTSFAQPLPSTMTQLREENTNAPDLRKFHELARTGQLQQPYQLVDNLLYYGHRLCLSRDSTLRAQILQEFHASPSAGHTGPERTFKRVASAFYWPGMKKDVFRYVRACHTCQVTKYSTQKPAGLLQPLPIPTKVWDEVTMDFIVGLPPSRGFSAIMVVVDRLSKYTHFGPLPTSFDATRVAQLFIDIVIKLHGIPSEIISDRDPIFMSKFWEDLFRLSGTHLKHSTAYHPQTDGQSEVTNRGLEQYLRAFTHERPSRWSLLLPWAELALNSSYHEGLRMTPFKALYGRDPPSLIPYSTGRSQVQAVDELLTEREALLRDLRRNLSAAQVRMKQQADKRRRDVQFSVGDWVLLKLRPYRQHSVAKPLSAKLARRFYGPFEVIERIGDVAYRLQLPDGAKIHNVFHVSLLRRYIRSGPAVPQATLPSGFVSGRPLSHPTVAHATREVLVHGVPQTQWLVSWSDGSSQDATWEHYPQILEHFPDLRLEDKAIYQTALRLEDKAGSQQGRDETRSTTKDKEGVVTGLASSRPKRNVRPPSRFHD